MLIPLEYRGKHPELFTEAIHSLAGIRGYHSHGDAYVRIVEEDEYGRILFYYGEDEYDSYRLIAQKSDGAYVYYYPDFNFISRSIGTSFSEQDIPELKDKNDWNKPLDESKFIKQKIVRIKAGHGLSKKNKEEIFRETTGGNVKRSFDSYLTSDKYGKKLFGLWSGELRLFVIINADDSCDLATCFIKFTDHNYQQELKEFKELNNWNEPWATPK
ncbi:MAG: hypothetical protein LBC85_08120 [Fibromonadaceae bacterium]|nr:hypothetical protein [Fibromonadaceae bacterium]